MRIISMEKGGDVKGVFSRLARGIKAVGDSVKAECGKDFALSEQFGYIHSCPTNLGTGMRVSVMIDLPGYTKEGLDALKKRCEELAVQPPRMELTMLRADLCNVRRRSQRWQYDDSSQLYLPGTRVPIMSCSVAKSNPIQAIAWSTWTDTATMNRYD